MRKSKLRKGTAVTLTLCVMLALWVSVGISLAQGAASSRAPIVQKLHEGNNAAALALAEEALKTAPRDCSLLSLKAIAHSGLQQQEAALEAFHKALTLCSTYLPALEGAAQIEFALGSTEAIPLLERVLEVQPANITAHAMLATAQRSADKCEEALPHYNAGKALFARRPDLQQGYGACLARTHDLQGALAQYKELLASEPNDRIRFDVALLQWKTHANDEALATLAPLLTDPGQSMPLALASKIHEEKGDTPQAVALLREAIVRAPEESDNYLDFAAIAFNHKSFQVGVDMLDAGLKRLPNAAPLYVARGVLEVQLSKSEAAVADFEQAHRLDPKLSFAVDAVGIMHSQQHQSGESLALLETQARQHPDDPLLQYLLAEQLSEGASTNDTAKLSAAIVAAKRASVLDPAYQAAHDLLASLYIRAKQPKLAIEQAEQALALDPNDQQALYQELMARRQTENRADLADLVKRLADARKESERKEQNTDRYRLQESSK